MKTIAGILVTALLLGGCTGAQWHRTGAADEVVAADARACDREANRVAHAEGRPGHQEWSTQGTRNIAGAQAMSPLRRVEHEEKYAACMKEKGYMRTSS